MISTSSVTLVPDTLSPHRPRRISLEEAQRLVLRDGDHTHFGVVQAITLAAHASQKDPDVRFAMERLAGDYLAGTPVVAEA